MISSFLRLEDLGSEEGLGVWEFVKNRPETILYFPPLFLLKHLALIASLTVLTMDAHKKAW